MTIRLKNESLKKYTSFKIGGSAEILSTPKDINELLSEIRFCDENNIPYKILGNGSNILVSDKGVKGFVSSSISIFSDIVLFCYFKVSVNQMNINIIQTSMITTNKLLIL